MSPVLISLEDACGLALRAPLLCFHSHPRGLCLIRNQTQLGNEPAPRDSNLYSRAGVSQPLPLTTDHTALGTSGRPPQAHPHSPTPNPKAGCRPQPITRRPPQPPQPLARASAGRRAARRAPAAPHSSPASAFRFTVASVASVSARTRPSRPGSLRRRVTSEPKDATSAWRAVRALMPRALRRAGGGPFLLVRWW